MAEGKKSFLAYCDWMQTFESLPDEEAGKLVKHLFKYVNDLNPETDSVLINAVFANMKNTLKRDLAKYDTFVDKQRENGKKGGRPKKPTETQDNPKKGMGYLDNPDEPKEADSVSVTDRVRDRDIIKTTLKSCNVPYEEIGKAYYLRLQQSGYESKSQKINNPWLDPLRKMVEIDKIPMDELIDTAKQYFERIDEKYIPQCFSTSSFRKKYQNLKAQLKPKNEPATKKEESSKDYAMRRLLERRKANGTNSDKHEPYPIVSIESTNES